MPILEFKISNQFKTVEKSYFEKSFVRPIGNKEIETIMIINEKVIGECGENRNRFILIHYKKKPFYRRFRRCTFRN